MDDDKLTVAYNDCLAATKIVRCKTWLSTLESVSPVARKPRKAVGPMYIGRVIPEYVKDPRAPVDKSRVLLLSTELRIFVVWWFVPVQVHVHVHVVAELSILEETIEFLELSRL